LGGEIKTYRMAKSAVNVAILSALTAIEVKIPNHKVLHTIIGALLHDVGMLRLPERIREKKGALTDEERKLMRSHPLLSSEIAVREYECANEVGDIVLQHHERWDGNGYPRRASGEGICVGARIVSIADSFEAMVSPRPYRSSIVGYQASKNILADNSRSFDPDILKAFILTMGIYPIGSIVCLSNGAVGRVSEVRARTPLRPKVQILVDQFKKMYKNEEDKFVDLLAEKNLYIAKALTQEELSEAYARA